MMMEDASADREATFNSVAQKETESNREEKNQRGNGAVSPPLRSNMAETAFFMPAELAPR